MGLGPVHVCLLGSHRLHDGGVPVIAQNHLDQFIDHSKHLIDIKSAVFGNWIPDAVLIAKELRRRNAGVIDREVTDVPYRMISGEDRS